MRIRITAHTRIADGEGRRYSHGQVAEVPGDLGTAWVAAGHAVSLEDQGGEKEPKERDKPRTKRTATRRAPRKADTE